MNTTGFAPKFLDRQKQRVAVEFNYGTSQHPEHIRHTLVATYCFVRSREIIDRLVDQLIQMIHGIGSRSEKRVEKKLLNDLRKVSGKTNILCQLAEAAIEHPDGVIRDVVYPVVSEKTLKALVKELKATGPAYRPQVQTVMRASYRGRYRRMLPAILSALKFRSNNEAHRPVIRGLELLKRYAESRVHYYDIEEEVPLKGVAKKDWLDLVIEVDNDGNERINRINYEVTLLQALRDRLCCKEIWVVGADRCRNPDDDLPGDFEERRAEYYGALSLPIDPEVFCQKIQETMTEELENLDRSMPKNSLVRILSRSDGWISVKPLDAQPEPQNLIRLKTEVGKRWPMTSLLDVLKETDLRIGLTECFRRPYRFSYSISPSRASYSKAIPVGSSTARVSLDRIPRCRSLAGG
ncbi:MAG TPA: hypothetical protein VE954_04155 [Oligoflexus sp.]|uniref:hypothetical protein n=1 Tax=Oligoflexus sp. TaxID=1971216 RepID=UPI002D3089BE|nr:hypothetical protein [Oligoflexus sp.]HYX32281.1 hypothetical protein [Oligoflexus sp.]